MAVHARHAHRSGTVLKISIVVTLLFSAVQYTGGLYAGSMSVQADAFHNFSDAVVLLLTWLACYSTGRAPSHRRTYGYGRASVLAAFSIAIFLLLGSGYLLWQSYHRIVAPAPPRFGLMFALGAASLLLNLAVSGSLRRASPVAFSPGVILHMIADASASLGIIVVAVLARFQRFAAADGALGLLICALIVWTTWDIVVESMNTLLEGLPRGIELDEVMTAIGAVGGVEDVHDLHVWTLGAGTHALSCHVRVAEAPLAQGEEVLRRINAVLEERFEIRHTTVQLEEAPCVAENGCTIPHVPHGAHDHHDHSH